MRQKPEIVGTQNILPSENATREQSFEEVTHQSIINKSSDLNFLNNFKFVFNTSKEYLGLISKAEGLKRESALQVAQEDLNFGTQYLKEPELTLEERLKQNHKVRKN